MGLIAAIIDTAKGNFVSDEVKRFRMSKCKPCNKMRGNTCIACGCYLPWKTSMPNEECPLPNPKWDKIE